MSFQTVNPLAMKGASIQSGFVNTGEVRWTRGGEQMYWANSGVGVATLIYSGTPGRLNSILILGELQSGQAVVFVDAAVATSGMPFVTSGHKPVGYVPPIWREGASGVINPTSTPGQIIVCDMPFFSGLYACPVASGTPSFAVSYTPETSGMSINARG